MPTIKTKKEMTAHKLITYGIKNNIKNIILEAINEKCKEKAIIHFNENAMPIVSRDVNIHHVFEVEVEEEITEDTVISEMLTIYDGGISHLTNNKSLNDLIKANLKSAYIMNDDLRLILIWRDGKMVE